MNARGRAGCVPHGGPTGERGGRGGDPRRVKASWDTSRDTVYTRGVGVKDSRREAG